MTYLPEGWDEYDANEHERSETPSYGAAREAAAGRAALRRASYGKALAVLRRARSLTQVALAHELGVAQGEVSRIEHQADLLLSTMARYVESMDAELALLVRFGDGQTVELGAVLEDLGDELPQNVGVPDVDTIIRLARYLGRYPYKEAEFHVHASR